MTQFLLFNNFHFVIEILGALAFLLAGWLTVDALLLRPDFLTASRGIGFLSLAAGQLIHALNVSSEVWIYTGYSVSYVGLIFLIWNLILETPVKRPEFKAIVLLPGIASALVYLNIFSAIGFLVIAYLAYRQYVSELKKSLFTFWLGFLFLGIGSCLSLFSGINAFGIFWIVGHVCELAGFMSIGVWVWRYLELRIREEMLLILVSLTLFMAVIVSLTFSTILLGRVQSSVETALQTEVGVLAFSIESLAQEALAKVRFISQDENLGAVIARNDFVKLDALAGTFIDREKLGFVTIADREGYVLVRGHGVSRKEETLLEQSAVRHALEGTAYVTIESDPAEKFSIRAAAPVLVKGRIVGVVIGGFPLDNALTDNIKRLTGLEMSVFEGDMRLATTIFNTDRRTRSVGMHETDSEVAQTVLGEGMPLTRETYIDSRPFLASFLPLRNADKKIVGMIASSKPQAEILDTGRVTNNLTLIIVVILMLILVIPIYLITKRLSEEVV